MSQHSLNIPNESGLLFRQDVNNAIQALASLSSGSTAPTTTYPFQFWCDTSGATPILKFRNAGNTAWIIFGDMSLVSLGLNGITYGSAPTSPLPFQLWIDTSGAYPVINMRNQGNTAWIVMGRADQTNFGHVPAAGGAMSGPLTFSNTDSMSLPAGTTAQRPVSPTIGMVRFNSTLVTFEGYNGTAWAPIGGGGFATAALQSIASGGTITTTTIDSRQMLLVQGSGGSVNASITPFGTTGGWKDGTEVSLVGNSDTNSLTLSYNDAAKGVVGNFTTLEITQYKVINLVYSSTLDRWVLR